MGINSYKYSPTDTNFNINQWTTQNYSPNQPDHQFGTMKTLKNRNTDQLIDRYQTVFTNRKDYQNYLKSFQWRKDQQYIVRAYHILTKSQQKYCSDTFLIDTFIQHPKNRLSDFSDIPYPDTLYVLKSMLSGYYKLYLNVGKFPIKDQQVCIDAEGHVRVWLNEDLSKNFPQEWEIQPRYKPEDEQEQQMVLEIVELIDKNSDHQQQPKPNFFQYFAEAKGKQLMGFEETLLLIDQYAKQNNTQIPEYFTSVVEVYQDQDQLYQLPNMNNIDLNNSTHNLFPNQQKKTNSQLIQYKQFSNDRIGTGSQIKNNYHSNNNSSRQSCKIAQKRQRSNGGGQGETYRLSNLKHRDINQKYSPIINNYNNVHISYQKPQPFPINWPPLAYYPSTQHNSQIESWQFSKQSSSIPLPQNFIYGQQQTRNEIHRNGPENKNNLQVTNINDQNITLKKVGNNLLNYDPTQNRSHLSNSNRDPQQQNPINKNQQYQQHELYLNIQNKNQITNNNQLKSINNYNGIDNHQLEHWNSQVYSNSRSNSNQQLLPLPIYKQKLQTVQFGPHQPYNQQMYSMNNRGSQEGDNINNGVHFNPMQILMNSQLSFRNLTDGGQPSPVYPNGFYPIINPQSYQTPSGSHHHLEPQLPKILTPTLSFQKIPLDNPPIHYLSSQVSSRIKNRHCQTFYCTLQDQIPLDPQIVNDMKAMNIYI